MTDRNRTAVLTAGRGADLQAVIDTRFFGEIPRMELTAVVASDPDCFALERARLAEIPAYVVERNIFPNDLTFSHAVEEKLRDLDVETIVLAGWEYPLPPAMAMRWSGRILCAWPSLLPLYGDVWRAPEEIMALVLQSGARLTGASACLLDDRGLPGRILEQRAVSVLPGDNVEKLRRRVLEEGERLMLPAGLALLLADTREAARA